MRDLEVIYSSSIRPWRQILQEKHTVRAKAVYRLLN